ncbi:MAG: isoprenylcysteine carboxylmethyltransferase family protein [Eubacteriales bacterium]|nr:isoprenylcysteine carboxylmethyltransferase family protein [Eubacteriales bacterium]
MGAWLLLPFFLLRFGLLYRLDRTAVRRAAHFAPVRGGERAAYWVYQISNAAIFVSLFFLRVRTAPRGLFGAGLAVYLAGLLLLAASVVNFAAADKDGFCERGLYRFSRNPMYVAYFVYFIGCALLTRSPVLLVFTLVFQLSAHGIILAEERWCARQFGQAYRAYMERVGRYL